MGFADYFSDLYASLTVQTAEAEQANPGPADTSGEQSRGSDTRAGGMSTAQHRGASVSGGASTKSPASGTNEESKGEQEENEKTAQSDDGDDADKSESEDDSEGGEDGGDDAGEDGGDDDEEEEEEEEEEEPEDPMPKIQEECMRTQQCAPLKHHFDECVERVQHQESQSGKAHEDCVEEYFHLMHCASQCAAPKLFKQLR